MKTIFITGASSGIGKYIKVRINYLPGGKEKQQLMRKHFPYHT